MEGLFGILWLLTLGGSVWGAIVLALKWAKHPLARTMIALALIAVFWVAGTTAIISGCVAVTGPVNFH
jgi:hypothetical protein